MERKNIVSGEEGEAREQSGSCGDSGNYIKKKRSEHDKAREEEKEIFRFNKKTVRSPENKLRIGVMGRLMKERRWDERGGERWEI